MFVSLLATVKAAQAEHGLRHDDFERYRKFCTRRILRLRAALDFHHGRGKKFEGRARLPPPASSATTTLADMDASNGAAMQVDDGAVVTAGGGAEDQQWNKWMTAHPRQLLLMVLFESERAWAHAMHLRSSAGDATAGQSGRVKNRRHAVLLKLRRAVQYATDLTKLCSDQRLGADSRLQLDAQAYALWMEGTLLFERQANWKAALGKLVASRTLYEKLAPTGDAEHEALCYARMDEIDPNIRYCAFNLNLASGSVDEIVKLHNDANSIDQDVSGLDVELQSLNVGANSEIVWLGKPMAVKSQKVAMALMKIKGIRQQLNSSPQQALEQELQDQLIQLVDEAVAQAEADVKADSAAMAKVASSKSRASSYALGCTLAYVSVMRFICVVERDCRMAAQIYHQLALTNADIAEFPLLKQKPAGLDSTKQSSALKPLDLARLFSDMHDGAAELLAQSADIQSDAVLQSQLKQLGHLFNGCKCLFMAVQHQASTRRWSDMLQLIERATVYFNDAKEANSAVGDSLLTPLMDMLQLPVSIAASIEWLTKFRLLAVSSAVLSQHKAGDPPKIELPPQMLPIAVKPVFYDLAFSQIMESLPLDELTDKNNSAQSPTARGSGGIIGKLGSWWSR